MAKLDDLAKLAHIAGVTVKESAAYKLEGKPCLLCGSGFHLIYDPYKNKEQAFDLMLKAGIELRIEDELVIANGKQFMFADYEQPHHCLCDAICTSLLK
ncbi:hypothetical protein VBJ55_22545 [Enterobacter hormaechei]|nr:hypothetical protein [Enterobacter hormaechei]UOK16646.1 hypothetical protein HBKIJOIA_00045 [Salmonella phage S1]